jgi:hypothetical protein
MKRKLEDIQKDYRLFLDIQMGKYYRKVNRTEFKSEDEAKTVINAVIGAWNKLIAPQKDKHDNLDDAGVVSWFNSIEIDFEKNES